ncbi:hypothetical protein PIB30_024878 [Stylosanthes scabra]|uniref:Uncharacterized protein n=1 Tax=Stylosanthes scabra TaxID=79078 RepID=A0ABU6RAH1_9FABA|nr:hypothetical protein [Stylosanthes scabra]
MSLCHLSIALSLVFAFLLLAFAAQLYYFLWWRKNNTTRPTPTHSSDIEMAQKKKKSNHYWVCWKVPRTTVHANVAKVYETELDTNGGREEEGGGSVEQELMRLHNLAGPPRFLFTIKEETKEDLMESEVDIRKSRSLSDLMCAIDDSPFLTPLGSLEFNPLFESSESEFNRFRSSPPPKFKFLRDAEEKLYRRLVEEGNRRKTLFGLKDSSHHHQHVTGSSQVLPLPSSPSTPILH